MSLECKRCGLEASDEDQLFCEECGFSLTEEDQESLDTISPSSDAQSDIDSETPSNESGLEAEAIGDSLLSSDPDQIDEFRLENRLGSGAFGVVYSARDSQGRRVALKLLRPELSDDQRLRRRLGREAEALRRVEGDRTVKIIDVVTDGDLSLIHI